MPAALDAPVTALGKAWQRFASNLDALLELARAHANAGTKFTVDLRLDVVLVEWSAAAASADDFRTHAYVSAPALVA